MAAFSRWSGSLVAPVDIASLASFRFLFGLIMCAGTLRYAAKGWIQSKLVEPPFHFTYSAFWFVHPVPAALMNLLFAILAIAAIGVALGFRYRLCATVFFCGFTYVELIDRAAYLNHYYLVSLLAGLLAVFPAARAFSLDARSGCVEQATTIPAWILWAMRIQVGLVYFYAGVAKLNGDWLLRAQPLRLWLAAASDLPLVGAWLELSWVAWAASWAGALFDLSIVPLLMWRRTRAIAFALVVVFHVATWALFPIGMFPWIMIVAATLLLPADWPRTLGLGTAVTSPKAAAQPSRWLAPLVAVHVVVQLALPLRQHFQATSSAWSLRGFNFAWNVMVAEKAGYATLEAEDRATGETFAIESRKYLAFWQESAMAQDPDLIRAFAIHVAQDFRERLGRDVAVRADAFASLNGRPTRRLIDPTVDLTGPLPPTWVASSE